MDEASKKKLLLLHCYQSFLPFTIKLEIESLLTPPYPPTYVVLGCDKHVIHQEWL